MKGSLYGSVGGQYDMGILEFGIGELVFVWAVVQENLQGWVCMFEDFRPPCVEET